ncbi:MAG: hypothetical protein LLF83_04810, partial [Methanobacterium sp.]|nr:hypothetical protein [Methanobacterium sp.]
PSSAVADIDDAVSKRHVQGTDQGLDTGGANAVTAAQAKAGYTHSGVTGNPHGTVADEINTTDSGKTVQEKIDDIETLATHSNRTILNNIQEALTTVLKAAYDGAVSLSHALHADDQTADTVPTEDSGVSVQDALNTLEGNSHAVSVQFNKATAAEISGLTDKATLVDADVILGEDSAAGTAFSKIKITWSNLKATLKSYFDTIYTREVILKILADGDSLVTGTGLMYFTVPSVLNNMNIVEVAAHVYTVSSSGLPTIDIYNNTTSHDILSTYITINESAKDSMNATTPAVINSSYKAVSTGDEIRIDVSIAGTGTKGLEVRIKFQS